MNREIKFRFWIFSQNTFYYAHTLQGIGLISKEAGNIPLNWMIDQQYTGLKDKNRKEIFEGDILSSGKEHVLCEGRILKNLYVVDYDKGSFTNPLLYQSINGSKFVKIEWPSDRAKNVEYTEMEIVGNIMENGELFK